MLVGAHPAAAHERALFERVRADALPRRPRRARRAVPAARAPARGALRLLGRAVRRPRAGRLDRPDQGDRPLRPGAGLRFSSFAVPTILGELKRHFRDRGWALHVPRTIQDRTLRITRATERLGATLGRAPTAAELGEALRPDRRGGDRGEAAASAYRTDSLDAPGDEDGAPLVDLLGADDEQFALVEERTTLAVSWRALPRAQRQVLRLRFVEDLTQREIGERIGYSQMHVSRLLREAIATLQRG